MLVLKKNSVRFKISLQKVLKIKKIPLDGLLGWCFYHLLRVERAVRLDAREQHGSSDNTTAQGYSNTNLCYYKLKKVLLAS